MDDSNNPLIIQGSPPPARADARRNREHLLEVAQHLFTQNGVEAVSMTSIADAADVGKGTLYRHFSSKVELCNALLDEDMRNLQANILTYMREHDDPTEKLLWFVQQILDFVLRNEAMLNVDQGARGVSLGHVAHRWWRQTLVGLLKQCQPASDVNYTADVLYVMLDVNTVRFQRNVLNYTPQQIHDGLRHTAEKLSRP